VIARPRFPGAPAHSDVRLVELARRGDERAFELIVRRHRGPLLSYCRRLGLGEARAEDAVQQSFLSAWLALCRGDEVRDLGAWLGRITHNSAVNLVRAGAGAPGAELAPEVTWDGRADIDDALALRHTLGAVAALPELQRDALLLSAVEGRSYEEVAGALGVTPGSVRGLLQRARATLRGAAGALAPAPLVRAVGGWSNRAGVPAARMADLAGSGATANLPGAAVRAAVALTTVAIAAGVAVGPLRVLGSAHGGHRAGTGVARPAASHAPPLPGAPRRALAATSATGAARRPSATSAGPALVRPPGGGEGRSAPGEPGSPRSGGQGSGGATTTGEAQEPQQVGAATPSAAAASTPVAEATTGSPPAGSQPAEQTPVGSPTEAPRERAHEEQLPEHEEEPPEGETRTGEPAPPPSGGESERRAGTGE
jgi:RNA polymerase sigma-70 factor (ECF subfamily)